MKSEPVTEMNGTPASPATALASNVFPVPGGPTMSMPLGTSAPAWRNREGSRRNCTTSWISSLTSLYPAMSSKVVCGWSVLWILPVDLPIWPRPPICPRAWRLMNQKKPTNRRRGNSSGSSSPKMPPVSDSASMVTPLSRRNVSTSPSPTTVEIGRKDRKAVVSSSRAPST